MDRVEIQAQDTTGNWRTYHVTDSNSQRILQEMKTLQERLPNYRIRAVDQNGRIVDIL
jgi:hypothetical protein